MKLTPYLAAAISVVAVSNAVAGQEECDPNAWDTYGMAVCAEARTKLIDDRLDQLYADLMQRLKLERNRERLKASQEAWISFVEKDCLYAKGTRDEGGSLWPLSIQECKNSQKKKRIQDLEGFMACTENGCPE